MFLKRFWPVLIAAAVLLACPALAGDVMSGLASPRNYSSARVSSNDPTGANNDGTQTNKIKAGETRTIANISGPGQVAHFWITTFGPIDLLRDVILRIYWDGEAAPSVECPLGEFFGLGHGKYYTFDSLPMAIGNDKGLNCFFPMPFRKSARFTIQNLGKAAISDFYFYIDYQKFKAPRKDLLYFHAQYRQEKPVLTHGNYTILDARGRGHYVGCFFYARQNHDGWWGEGDDMIFIDGAKDAQLKGTGTEDYFCHSWGFANNTYTSRFGAPFSQSNWKQGDMFSVYRFHLEDAIAFTKSIRVTMEHGYEKTNDRSDDFSSVAYWYQTEPHAAFPRLAQPAERRSMAEQLKALLDAKRFDDYRARLGVIRDRTPDTWMRPWAELNMANSYARQGDNATAIRELQKLYDSNPGKTWKDSAAAKIKEFGGELVAQ